MRVLLALFAAVGVAPAHLGSGDDVVPRDTVSIVESVSPALPPGVAVDVVGGDTFLRVRSRGHEIEIAGYDNEPYIRIRKNGDVFETSHSTTWYLNRARYGGTVPQVVTDPPGGRGTATGEWTRIAANGTAMWHDHRIHWMSPSRPVTIDERGTVQHWKVTVTVDGTTHTVSGTLRLKARASVLWWAVAPAAVLLSLWLLRGDRLRWYSIITWTSALSCFVGFLEWRDLPAGAQVTPLMLLFGVVALLASNAATVLQKSAVRKDAARNPARKARNDWVAGSLAAGAGVTLVVSAWINSVQVRAAYVPFMGPLWMPRLAVTLMLGVGMAAAIDGVVRAMRVQPQPQ